MFERSEFARLPPGPSNAVCPERSGGTTHPARLLFAYFLLAKQEKVSRLPGRDPACHESKKCIAEVAFSLLTFSRQGKRK